MYIVPPCAANLYMYPDPGEVLGEVYQNAKLHKTVVLKSKEIDLPRSNDPKLQ